MARLLKPGKGQVVRKMANPTPATLLIVNPIKGAKKMATTKAKPRRKRRKPNPTRRYASRAKMTNTAGAIRRRKPAAKKNPLIIYRTKKANPGGSEILEFVLAGTGIGFVQPWLASLSARFGIPGQYVTPVSTAGSGVSLYYLFGMFRQTKRYAQPALILGVSTAIVSIIAPVVRRWLMPSAPMQQQASGPQGIGIWSGQPLRMASRPSALPPAKQAVAAAGPQGIGVWPTPAGRFGRR